MTDSELTGSIAGTLPKCVICLGPCINKCHSDSCKHEFCFECLLEWSKTKTECPICKQPFSSIIYNIKSLSEYDEIAVSANIASDTSSDSSHEEGNLVAQFVNFVRDTLEECPDESRIRARLVVQPSSLNFSLVEYRHKEQSTRGNKRQKQVTSSSESDSNSDSDYKSSKFHQRKLNNKLPKDKIKAKRQTRSKGSDNKDNLPLSSFANRRKRSKHTMQGPQTVKSPEDRKQALCRNHRHSSHYENSDYAKKNELSLGSSKCMQGDETRNRSSSSYSEHKPCVKDLRNDDKHKAGPSSSRLRNTRKKDNFWFSRPYCPSESDSSSYG